MSTGTNLIKNIDDIFAQFLKPDQKLMNYNVKPLTVAGENYGSIMIAIRIIVKNTNDNTTNTKTINAVAKIVPQNPVIQKFFHTAITFRKEVGLYREILPALRSFMKSKDSLEFFPKVLATRLNLHSKSKEPDYNAVLMLEDLKVQNYRTLDRTIGFNLEETELILKDLAELHATVIACKLAKPGMFKRKILPYLDRFAVFGSLKPETMLELRNQTLRVAEENDQCRLYLNRVQKALEFQQETIQTPFIDIREPYATLIHNDYWTNNTMIKFENDEPIKNKMVDFQVIEYGSPARDILFFLYSSVQIPVLAQNYEQFVRYYYKIFISILERFNTNTKPFSYDGLLKEIDYEARNVEFFHNIIMLGPLYAPPNSVKEIGKLTEEDLILHHEYNQSRKNKLWFIILEFVKNNWI